VLAKLYAFLVNGTLVGAYHANTASLQYSHLANGSEAVLALASLILDQWLYGFVDQ